MERERARAPEPNGRPQDVLVIMKPFACSSGWIREEWSALCARRFVRTP